MEPTRFESVLADARAGIERAWSEIYAELAPAVLGYLRSNGAPEPEDVLSEAFLQVARDLPRFEGSESKFRAWVFKIAHHRMIDARRQQARRPADPVADPPEPPGPPSDDVSVEVLAGIGKEEIRELFGDLSPDQRAVLLLRVLGELTVDEVARILDKRPGAIKALQRRGLLSVQRQLLKRGVPL